MLLLLVAVVARAESLSLADAQHIAWENNWDVVAAKSALELASAQKIIAREFPNPVFSYSLAKINVDHNASNSTTYVSSDDGVTHPGNGLWDRSYDSIFSLSQLFETGGKRAKRGASAEAGIHVNKARLDDARRLVRLAVSRAYIATLLAEANARVLSESALALGKEADIAQKRFAAGDLSRSDKEQIEIAAQRLDLDARSAGANARSLKLAFENAIGVSDPRDDWIPADSLEALAVVERPPVMEGLPHRPDLDAAQAAVDKAAADLKLQQAMRLPDPTVSLQYEHQPPDQPNTVGVGVSLPLPLWNQNRGEIHAAEAAVRQAQQDLERQKAQARLEIKTAVLTCEDLAFRWHAYQNEIRPKSAEIRRSVSFAYEKGGATLLDLLAAQRTDNEVRLATAQAAADTASAAAMLAAAFDASRQIAQKETSEVKSP